VCSLCTRSLYKSAIALHQSCRVFAIIVVFFFRNFLVSLFQSCSISLHITDIYMYPNIYVLSFGRGFVLDDRISFLVFVVVHRGSQSSCGIWSSIEVFRDSLEYYDTGYSWFIIKVVSGEFGVEWSFSLLGPNNSSANCSWDFLLNYAWMQNEQMIISERQLWEIFSNSIKHIVIGNDY